jgi:hypothetical protein
VSRQRVFAALLPLLPLAAQETPAPAPAAPAAAAAPATDAPPNGARKAAQFYFVIYPNFLCQYDPGTDAIVRKIPFQNGMPWDVSLLHDRRRFTVVTDQQKKIEVVDLDKGAVTEVHDFAKDGYIVRIRSITEIPGGDQWYVRLDRIKKLPDRYQFEQAQTLLYDRKQQKVVRELRRMPEILSRGARISPDGTKWHVFDQQGDILVVDPATLKEVGKVDLSTPLYAGAPRVSLGRTDLLDGRDPKHYRMLVNLSDRVERNRNAWGYVDIDLDQNKITNLVEWGPGPSGFGTYVARDAKVAVTMGGGFGGGFGGGANSKTRIALYDLETGKKLRETAEEFRPRAGLEAISPDGKKIYVCGAGSDFTIFDADTLQKLKVVDLEGEVYGQVHVLDG